ncbi:MAG TPA: ABC transporter ATP-binding protein [Spirochaetia bacterium]|nr:ABC transporter ATP-binding protein [Spirochaetia bacterium]
MIRLEHLSKRYGKNGPNALNDLTFSVERGELFGFLGPNGAGKTTTIKILVGLLRPDSGRAEVDGIDCLSSPLELKRRIGYVPDEPMLYDNLTGGRFLGFIADVYEVPTDKRSIIAELAEQFELKGQLDERISAYSHGMRQKLSIIAALLHRPEVFILDEPIVGLDPRASFVLKEKMRELCSRGGTVFFSTHVMEVAERLCDRVGIIRGGRMIAAGPLAELRRTAGEADATLEKLFLELTDEDALAP